MNISYVNSNKTTSLPVELDALNNKDISYAKDFFLYIETQLKIAKDFLDLEKKYLVLLQVKFFTHLLI
ncbi:protein YjbS [Escherichia coli]|uniref:protein YjbS n=1 Tax=Escherichia coli TaxID=562 RepID=UPI001E50D2E0|nr:protein YjbS [Escherichia coli]